MMNERFCVTVTLITQKDEFLFSFLIVIVIGETCLMVQAPCRKRAPLLYSEEPLTLVF
jgi:hypothetical protein